MWIINDPLFLSGCTRAHNGVSLISLCVCVCVCCITLEGQKKSQGVSEQTFTQDLIIRQ